MMDDAQDRPTAELAGMTGFLDQASVPQYRMAALQSAARVLEGARAGQSEVTRYADHFLRWLLSPGGDRPVEEYRDETGGQR